MNDEVALVAAIHELAKSNNKVAENLANIVNNIFGQMLTKSDLLEHEKREEATLANLFADIKTINERAIRSDQTSRIVRYVLTYGGIVAAGFSLSVLVVLHFASQR